MKTNKLENKGTSFVRNNSGHSVCPKCYTVVSNLNKHDAKGGCAMTKFMRSHRRHGRVPIMVKKDD